MCGVVEAAIIKAEPGVCVDPALALNTMPAPALCLSEPALLGPHSPSPPTISIQDPAPALGKDPPPPQGPGLPYTLTLALPSHTAPAPTYSLSALLPLHPLPPAGHAPTPRQVSPLLSISEVTNTLLDHNQ